MYDWFYMMRKVMHVMQQCGLLLVGVTGIDRGKLWFWFGVVVNFDSPISDN